MNSEAPLPGVYGLGLGFRVLGLGFWVLGFRVQGSEFRACQTEARSVSARARLQTYLPQDRGLTTLMEFGLSVVYNATCALHASWCRRT